MIILNFSHPLTMENIKQIETLSNDKVREVITIPAQLDASQDFTPQVIELFQSYRLDPILLQIEPILVNLPSFNLITAILLAELHGRMGYFPAVMRLRTVEGAVPPRFEVAELINLQGVRDAARSQRGGE